MNTLTQKQVRNLFWDMNPQFKSEYRATKRQNDYNCTIRSTFNFFVDSLQRDGQITMNQAAKYTL